MIRFNNIRICLLAIFAFIAVSLKSQQVNTMYFQDNLPVRHYFNPSFQPYSDFIFQMPLLGYTQFYMSNNSLTMSDLFYKVNDESVFFLSENGNRDKFYNALKPTTLIETDIRFSLLGFGFRAGKGYFTFDLNQRFDGGFGLPRDFMKLLLYGTPDLHTNVYDLSNFALGFSSYSELALGYSRNISDKLNVGAKIKYLHGNTNFALKMRNSSISANVDEFTFKTNTYLDYSGPTNITMDSDFGTLDVLSPVKVTQWLKPSGIGVGVDLGATFKPTKYLSLSAALLDLGSIRWKTNATTIANKIDYAFDGFGKFGTDTKADFEMLADSLFKEFNKATTTDQTFKSYTTATSPKLNVGVEYSFWRNMMSLGLLSRTIKHENLYSEELTASINGRPSDWINLSASYSAFNGRFSNIGASVGLRTGFLNWFASVDYFPVSYAKLPFTVSGSNHFLPVSYNSRGVNFAAGVSIVFGNRKDADFDGVVDKKDKCPETPFSVIVDRKGCPMDTDGDGVPDYLDKCPKTPKEAYNRIDQNGCPVDTDGDGVPDYKDKCPDTPKEAVAYVDSTGCVADTDKDGVVDFKDKCPGTPIGVKVDSIGCPLDTDQDGVADYKDKCPGTPQEARNFVDSLGCPIDRDQDGVLDYMDKCPDTPASERLNVDKDGCTIQKTVEVKVEQIVNTLDTDGDGVIDAEDKCPGTPAAARGFVDKNGCPLDSDGDGVPDYRDSCPKVAGSVANNGCPEIKKEIQSLLRKALQGIQFETGKYSILPVSFKILNQIAGVMKANPDYILEIRGHTDNVGKSSANQILSQNRAKAVMKYLTTKGVAASRMTSGGYGDTLPVASNKTTSGRWLNRRVEFVVTYKEITFD